MGITNFDIVEADEFRGPVTGGVTGDITSTNATVTNLTLDTGTKTETAVAGAATLNKTSGKITTEALTTAAGAAYTLTLTNSAIAADDIVLVSVSDGTNSAGSPVVGSVNPGAGSAVILVHNIHAADAFNGTLEISFAVIKG